MTKRSEIAKAGGFWRGCPYCKTSLPIAVLQRKYLNKDGRYISITFGWEVRKAAFEECQKCGKRWPLWAGYEEAPSSDILIVATSQSEEHIGSETRRIENQAPATIQRALRVSREWARKIERDTTRASLTSSEGKF